jgi:hypothetical protein
MAPQQLQQLPHCTGEVTLKNSKPLNISLHDNSFIMMERLASSFRDFARTGKPKAIYLHRFMGLWFWIWSKNELEEGKMRIRKECT